MRPLPLDVHGWQLELGEIAPTVIVDLRDPHLFERARLRGAQNVPYHQLQAWAPDHLTDQDTVLVVDPAGARAAEMAVWLRRHGIEAAYLVGGYAAWTGPLERPA